MRGRIAFVAGATVGYVLGARAGRRRYEQIKSAADRVWNDRNGQKGVGPAVDSVQGFVREKAPEVQGAVVDQAKKVASKVRRSSSDAPTPSI